MTRTVKDMEVGDIGYTTPWQAFKVNRRVYLPLTAHLFGEVYGTSCMAVQRTKAGVKVICMGEECRNQYNDAIQEGGEFIDDPREGILVEDVSTLSKVKGQWVGED